MATQIKISELPLASEDALSLASDDRFIFNNDNINTQTIKFGNLVDAICEQNLTFTGNCSFTQKIVGPDGGDIQVGLDGLVDVQLQNVTSGQVLSYSGTQWINQDVKSIALQLDSLSVEISDTPSGGGSLAYDNTTGTFTFTPAVEGSFTPSSISVATNPAASGGGSLVYNSGTTTFTFTPADCYTKGESYSKSEVDSALGNKVDAGVSYTKVETNTLLNAKLDVDGGITVITTAPMGGGNLAYTSGTLNFQPADLSGLASTASLATVATTGSYTDLLNIPTLGTAAAQETTAFATAEQGLKADSALQDASAFATAAQGALADTALQPAAIGTTVQAYSMDTVVDASYATVQSGAAAGATAVQAAAGAITVTSLATDGSETVDSLATAINTLTAELAAILNA